MESELELIGLGTVCTGQCAGSIVRERQAGTCGCDSSSWCVLIIEHRGFQEDENITLLRSIVSRKSVIMLESPFDNPLNGSIDR